MKISFQRSLLAAAASVGVIGLIYACTPRATTASLATGDAASKVYVPPGSYDEFYAFLSGGYSGQVAVYGLPSGRLLKTIPVFSQFPEDGYGYNEDSKPLLQTTYGFIPWDDSHHPELSMTDGVPDGRWLFINGNNTPRIARIDLTRFETDEIIQIPNSAGGHASPFSTPDSKYVVSATRFSVPIPNTDVPIYTNDQGNYFKPNEVHTNRGDVIRFTLKVGVHNVHFLPDSNAGRTGYPQAPSDFLQLPGQTYDVAVKMPVGSYYFQCDPHAALGMKGHLIVH